MRSFIRRTTTLAVLGALAVASSLPAAAESGQVERITQRQSIKTELSSTGEPGTSRVFTQLKATGSGPVTVALPQQSTRGLRSLDGFASPDVNGDEVVWTLDASEDGTARSVADNTAELPVSVSVVYRLDGEEVDPKDLAGEDGQVEVEYTVSNLTAEPRDIVSFDAENNKVVETVDVAVPMVGSLSLTLPPQFANIDAPGAVTVGDGRGNTVVNFSLLLFAPLGSDVQTVSWTADAVDTAIPETSLQVLPVDDKSFNSLNSTAEAYKGASGSLSDLANGALIINSNLLLLGSGASQLLDGLNQLSDGADQLSDGLANTAAPGARQLSDGMSKAREGGGKLTTGLGELALGATRLSDGLGAARAGGGKLSAGLGDLALGATRLSVGLGAARTGAGQLAGGLGDLATGAGTLSAGLTSASTGADDLAEGLADRAAPGAIQIRDGLSGLLTALGAEDDVVDDGTLIGGVNSLLAGLTGDLAQGTGALALLSTGLADSFGPDPDAGGANAGQKAAGAAAGADQIVTGAGGIADGAAAIARGLQAVQQQNGQIPGIEHLDASDLICLDPTPGQVVAGTTLPPPGCITQEVFDGLAATLVALGLAPDAATAAAFLTSQGVEVAPTEQSSQLLIPLTAFLASLIGNLTTNELSIQNGALAIGDGAEQLRDGLQAQADSLGTTWPTCAEAIAAAQTAAAGGDDPTGLEVIQALACISGQVHGGLTTEVIPGVQRLRGGISNPTAFDSTTTGYNPGCEPATIANGLQPCGVKQALQLLGAGSSDLADGLDDAAVGSGALAEGLRLLAAGGGQLSAGAGAARDGSVSLLDGLRQLDDGGEQLAAGAGAASAGSKDLASGLGQLDDGAGQLAAGADKAASGSRDLASGLVQLDDGALKLANGLGDAADGSVKIADGLGSAEEGGGKIADGVGKLQEGFEERLIGGVSAGRQGASHDYETVRAVIQRGKEGAAPYGIAEGAESTTVFQFDLAGVGTEEGPSTPILALFALVALAVAGGLGLGLRRMIA